MSFVHEAMWAATVAVLACGVPHARPAGSNAPMTPDLARIVEAALADAARVSGRERSRLTVESAARVTWADSSLGCPAPGTAYAQALVPGYRIRIRAGSTLLDYHASARGALVLCPPERATEPLPDDRT